MNPVDLASRLTVASITAGMLVLSIQLILQDASFTDYRLLARKVEQRPSLDERLFTRIDMPAMQDAAQATCRTDILRPALTLVLYDLDRQDPGKDYQKWQQALQRANKFSLHMTDCLPSDGNSWLRQAMISRAIAEEPVRHSQIMNIAALLGPAEMPQLEARLFLWQRMSETTRKNSRRQIVSDIHTILAFADRQSILRIFANLQPPFAVYFDTALKSLPKKKQESIQMDLAAVNMG